MKKNMGHRYLISSLFFLFSLLFNLLGPATTHSAPPAARSPAARSRTLTRHRRRSARRRSVGRVLALHRSAPLCRPPVRLPACSGCSPPPCAHPPPPPPPATDELPTMLGCRQVPLDSTTPLNPSRPRSTASMPGRRLFCRPPD